MKKKRNIRIVLWVMVMFAMCSIAVLMQNKMDEYLRAKCTHLSEYPYFNKYNRNHYFNEFIISEAWRDGYPFYRLSMYDTGLEIEINRKQTEVKVRYEGDSVSFPVNGFISTNANLYLADLTGDGMDELIYEEPMSGADGNVGSCQIVDLNNMYLLDKAEPVSNLLDNVSVEIISQEGKQIFCKVTDLNHHIYFGNLNCGRLEQSTDCIEANGCHAIEYDVTERKLKAYTCFTLNGCETNSFLGEISTYYKYNQNTKEFELEDDYSVTLWKPVNVSADT